VAGAGVDLARLLRRLKPDKLAGPLPARRDADLAFAEREQTFGPPLLLDACVYLHVLKGETPAAADRLIAGRTILHSAVAVAELTHRFGRRAPANERERAARARLAEVIEAMPARRVHAPGTAAWAEAGILAGLLQRMRTLPPESARACLDDALLIVQARDHGAALLTANIRDFDILQQLVPAAQVVFYRAA
jgi:predicted nucleic acid-binding protein